MLCREKVYYTIHDDVLLYGRLLPTQSEFDIKGDWCNTRCEL